jgi:hypothetical protein
MSAHDEIGDLSGSQIHLWPSDRTRAIVEKFPFTKVRSNLKLDRDVSKLEPEIRAAEIARSVYADNDGEFGTSALQLAAVRARTIASLIDPPVHNDDPKEIIGFVGQKHYLVQWSQELAWLSFALEFGATDADLLAWGVDEFVVVQLIWWQRKPGETLLNQHVRALRNGWALPALAESVRDTYGNLLRFVEKGQVPEEMLKEFEVDFAQVRELIAFFEPQSTQLTDAQRKAWAKVFEQNVEFIVPDAKGRWAMLPKVSLKKGELRWPTNDLARFFEYSKITPSELAGLEKDFFGRVGDSV